MKAQIEKVDASNLQLTIKKLTDLSAWYRDVLDEELIAAWKEGNRGSLPDLVESFADTPLAIAIVEFSWRQQRQTTFVPQYESMLETLMGRYGDSAKPFFDDLLGSIAAGHPMELSQPEAETVCRILLNLPDIRDFRVSALKILPHYAPEAKRLLDSDLRSEDRETQYRASRWIADLPRSATGQPETSDGASLKRRGSPGSDARGNERGGDRSILQKAGTSGALLKPLSGAAIRQGSVDGNANALIEFINRSNAPVDVYWINYSGERSLMLSGLRVGGSVRARTALGQLWLVVAAGSDSATRSKGFEAITANDAYDPSKRDIAIID